MAEPYSEQDRLRLMTELGFQRWEAIGHFLGDGDYLGFNQSDYRGAIAEYEKAWELLSTPWQRQTAGADILEGIADFALRSEDPNLASEVMASLEPRMKQGATPSMRDTCEKLAELASGGDRD